MFVLFFLRFTTSFFLLCTLLILGWWSFDDIYFVFDHLSDIVVFSLTIIRHSQNNTALLIVLLLKKDEGELQHLYAQSISSKERAS